MGWKRLHPLRRQKYVPTPKKIRNSFRDDDPEKTKNNLMQYNKNSWDVIECVTKVQKLRFRSTIEQYFTDCNMVKKLTDLQSDLFPSLLEFHNMLIKSSSIVNSPHVRLYNVFCIHVQDVSQDQPWIHIVKRLRLWFYYMITSSAGYWGVDHA